ILEEDGRIYEVLTAVPGNPKDTLSEKVYEPFVLTCGVTASKELQLQMGPYLLRQPNRILIDKWERELHKLEMISTRMLNSSAPEAQAKREELHREIDI